ncbi:hypothetical protein H6P81_011365 [Aristolochia fimbriata]|uniref:Uncharacterized protein n=1 Tax=Aristolochia fimbriata TaxID=158543 RepID=A0AAV7ER96_ARIFI|nr:hypothetical protein H6P81_011365 [Aristolochia fimbriata]
MARSHQQSPEVSDTSYASAKQATGLEHEVPASCSSSKLEYPASDYKKSALNCQSKGNTSLISQEHD